ncbi:MAG: helix-turn-helix domain-containing protein [Arcicella sp.]|jgi:transcriptional regulator with XRE-family HTH domain|nr:helix-turn-helix domain-containing protein [Arcicella sp.]
MKTPLKLGEKVSIVREMKKISQKWVATQLKISQQAYQKLEQGETIMTNDKLATIASVLEVDEQMIRDIDKHPIINSNPRNCHKFGNYQTVCDDYGVKEEKLDIENGEDRIAMLRNEMESLKLTIESLANIVERKLNLV